MLRMTLSALAALSLALVPLASAELQSTSTPAFAECVLVDTDGCALPWSSAMGAYAVSATGVFTGTVTLSVSDGFNTFTQACTDLVGIFALGGCTLSGSFPAAGPMTMTCASEGTGAVACSVEGA